ncbi:hypothetical protein BV22DRAFT_82460 [Leucogyrophana mollusca]|uniref:Uncharacterized protein n=1 Tax=Leucogyrophana mollusca TaxID=85980 RepID=A0ACB8BW82_9AGAM|nr:hypothetical protein BV22DRAFT_82460 [Leucogyrophana mollusca]
MPSEAPVAGPSGTRHDDDDSGRPSKILKTQSRPPVSQSASTTARSPYFSNAAAASNNPSAALARERILSPARPDPIIDSDEDFEAFVSMPRGRPEVPMEPSSDYDLDMDMDEEFLAQADRLEMEALGSQGHMPAGPASSRSQTTNSTVGSGSGRSGPPNMSSSSSSQARSRAPLPVEVIEIDDDEDDKENVQVPKRRPVHRRTGPAPDDEIISISD